MGNPDCPDAVWLFDLASATDGTRLRYRAGEIVAARIRQFVTGMDAVVADVEAIAESNA